MNKTLTKYAVLTISVLAAALLNEFVIGLITEQYKERSYLSVLIGMLLTVIVFVPLVGVLGKYVKRFSAEYINRSKRVAKSSMVGLLLGFLIAFLVLFVLFAYIRHDLDVFKDLSNLF